MAFTVFYAWQMDRPTSVNRWFIETAIKSAIRQVKAEAQKELELDADLKLENALPVEPGEEDAVNPDQDADETEIVLQWGAAGEAGAKLIAETILERIGRCGVYVGDLTFVSEVETPDKRHKKLPNANVLIETGAASRTGLGWDRMILVLNTAFGKVDDLPFDLKHRHCTVQYELGERDDPRKAEKRKQLAKDFADQIRPMYRKAMTHVIEERRRVREEVLAKGTARAAQERQAFEQHLLDNTYHDMRTELAVMVATIIPAVPPNGPLKFDDDVKLMRHFQPPGMSSGCQITHRPKSVTCGEFAERTPYNMVELANTGNVLMARNLVFGRDGIGPSYAEKIDPSKGWLVAMDTYQPQFIDAVRRYLTGVVALGVNGPWFFSLSILKMRNGLLIPSRDWYWMTELGKPFTGDNMTAGTILLPADLDLSDQAAVTEALKPPLKEIWRHNGHRGMPIFEGPNVRMEP